MASQEHCGDRWAHDNSGPTRWCPLTSCEHHGLRTPPGLSETLLQTEAAWISVGACDSGGGGEKVGGGRECSAQKGRESGPTFSCYSPFHSGIKVLDICSGTPMSWGHCEPSLPQVGPRVARGGGRGRGDRKGSTWLERLQTRGPLCPQGWGAPSLFPRAFLVMQERH